MRDLVRVSGALALTAALAAAGVARAQESPTSLTRAERRCQERADACMQRFTRNAVHCLEDCYREPGRSCDGFFLDTQTLACLDRARNLSAATAIRNCAGFACPECYGGVGCSAFLGETLDRALLDVAEVTNEVLCDDAFSADGLSVDERRCQLALTRAGARLADRVARCLALCRERVGETDPASCIAVGVDGAAFDAATQACIDQARAEYDDACARKCADPPECLALSCEETRAHVEREVLATTSGLQCFDNVCGDGLIGVGEICDQTAPTNGCAAGLVCLGCALCLEPFCGDGVVSAGEECDPFAPTLDCGFPSVCRDDCTCGAPPSFCVPTAPDTCTGGVTGCFESCDGGTIGNACVATTEGTAVCVEEICTFIECTSSAACGADAVCFTEGCCGPGVGLGTSARGRGWGP